MCLNTGMHLPKPIYTKCQRMDLDNQWPHNWRTHLVLWERWHHSKQPLAHPHPQPTFLPLKNSVNTLLWQNVSITQRPISHTHYNGNIIHITALCFQSFFSFFPSIYLTWMIPPRSQTKMATVGGHESRIITPLTHLTADGLLFVSVHVHLCAY